MSSILPPTISYGTLSATPVLAHLKEQAEMKHVEQVLARLCDADARMKHTELKVLASWVWLKPTEAGIEFVMSAEPIQVRMSYDNLHP